MNTLQNSVSQRAGKNTNRAQNIGTAIAGDLVHTLWQTGNRARNILGKWLIRNSVKQWVWAVTDPFRFLGKRGKERSASAQWGWKIPNALVGSTIWLIEWVKQAVWNRPGRWVDQFGWYYGNNLKNQAAISEAYNNTWNSGMNTVTQYNGASLQPTKWLFKQIKESFTSIFK